MKRGEGVGAHRTPSQGQAGAQACHSLWQFQNKTFAALLFIYLNQYLYRTNQFSIANCSLKPSLFALRPQRSAP